MYLSQCVLNTVRPINPYQLHQKIWKLFPDQEGEERSFLFRVENLGQTGAQKILLQSEHKPQSVAGDLFFWEAGNRIHVEKKVEKFAGTGSWCSGTASDLLS